MYGTFWWLRAEHEGHLVILGPYESEIEANRAGVAQLHGNFKAYELPTRDKGRATSMIKNKILEETKDLGQALRRASHQV